MYLPLPIAILFTIILAFLSHFLVDTIAKITYHTPTPHKDDKFWVSWMYISNGINVAFVVWVIIVGRFFFFLLGAFFAVLVDIYDWTILRPIQNKRKKPEDEKSFWEQGYFFHKVIDKIRDDIPPFSWLPNWNYKKKAVIPELIIITILWILIILMM